jgi:hypothetical protein
MNSDDIAANSDNMMHHHVEVVLESGSILVRGLVDMITHGDGM